MHSRTGKQPPQTKEKEKMKFKVKDMDIATGDIQIVILNEKDAQEYDLHPMDRLVVKKGKKKTVAILDIAESKKAVPPGQIGFFEEALDAINAKHGDTVTIDFAEKPKSVQYIKKKLNGKTLTADELRAIVQDIVDNNLTDIELTTFVTASYANKLTNQEIADLTIAMMETGDQLTFKKGPIVDLHSIGGVPGNRTTMLMVPLLVAAGCTVPKTSSRAITSPAGTADTMEVLCDVSHNINELKKIINDAGGFIVWGGAVNLAPADDKIIRVEHPINIDAEGQMLASIMSKKASVGTTHLLMEIPHGPGTKVKTRKEAKHLEGHFNKLSKLLNINIKVVITDGSQPVGRGIGPVLEARDVLWALSGHENAPKDLIKKSLKLTGILLEFVGKARKGQGYKKAKELLDSGAAYDAMTTIVHAQGGKMRKPEQLKHAKHSHTLKASKTGKLVCYNNKVIAKAARLAGAPIDQDAGLYIHKHCREPVKKGDPLITIYSCSKRKLNNAKEVLEKRKGVQLK